MASEPFRKIRFPSAPGRTRLLLCDNHSSHDTFGFYEYCLANSIALFFLPSHATHVLQPLDVGVFAPLDKYCSQEVDGWTASQPLHTPLTKAEFFPMCEQARRKALTLQNIRSAWSECGIHPFKRVRVISNPKYSLLFRAPLNHHLHANFALFAIAPHLLVLRLNTPLLLLRHHRLHWMITTISLRTSGLLHKRWKLISIWQRQSFTRLLPTTSPPSAARPCFPKLAL